HFRSSRLLLKALRKIACALTQFVEQPRILGSDDDLGSKTLHKLNLLVCKWSKLLAVDNDSTNQSVVFEHRNRNDRSCSAESSCQTGNCISRTVSGVDHLLRSVHLVKKATRRGQPKSRLRGSSLRRFQECSEKSLGFFDLWKLRSAKNFRAQGRGRRGLR